MEIITNKKPLVSVIIDTYNYGKFIDEAIQSVLNQTFPNQEMEIIVVDDGSTDPTPEIVKKYGNKIIYIYKENKGQASAFNVGFENAKGKHIFLLDADDYFLPEKIETCVKVLEEDKDIGLIYHFLYIKDEIKNEMYEQRIPKIDGIIYDDLKKLLLYPSQATCGLAVKKETLKYIYPLPEKIRIAADACIARIIPFYYPIKCIRKYLAVNRIHRGNFYHFNSLSIEKIKNRRENCYFIYLYVKDILEKIDYVPLNFKKKFLLRNYTSVLINDILIKKHYKEFTFDHIKFCFINFKLYWRFSSFFNNLKTLLTLLLLLIIPSPLYFALKERFNKK